MIRKEAVAGKFYTDDKEELQEEVEDYLSLEKSNMLACIVPHAGYMFSGELAGKVLGKFREKKDFIILGVNHSGKGDTVSFSALDFSTPFGIVKNNLDLGKKIMKKLQKIGINSGINEESHEKEHSIEVQLPFLQVSQKKFSIVPILLKDLNLDGCKKIAECLAEFIDDSVGIIVSSDFTHYGKSYGFVPFKENIKRNLYYLDNEIIINLLNKNTNKVFDLASKSTVCGIYGISILSEIAKINKMKGKLEEYYTSGDITGDFENCVGYVGISFS